MAIDDLNVTENYAALQILRQSQLNTAMTSIENWVNTRAKLNLIQIGLDVFGNTYSFNNDGLQTRVTPLVDSAAILTENETVQGSWTFNNTVAFNQAVSFAGIQSSSGQPRVKAYVNAANQSIPDSLATALAYTNEVYDVANMHDNGLNTTRLTVPTGGGGIYQLHAQATFAASAVGRREISIFKNGSVIAKHTYFAVDGAIDLVGQVSVQDTAAVGDFYTALVFQNSGGALDVKFGPTVSFFSAIKVW